MKKSKVLLLSLGMALCVGGGIGAAVAISKNPANNGGTGNFDKAVCLYWGQGLSSVTLADMENLTANVAQYRYLEVTPYASSASGNVKVTFTLDLAELEDKTAVLTGLQVAVYKTASLANDSTVGTLISGVTPDPVLGDDVLTGDVEIPVVQGESANYFAIEVVYDGTPIAETEKVAGILNISQTFIPANAA